MASKKRKPTTRARSKAAAPSPEELEDDTVAEAADTEDTDTADDTDTDAEDSGDTAEEAKGAAKDKRAKRSAKDPVRAKRTPGGEVPEKAKDATPASRQRSAAAEGARTGRRRVAAVAPNPAWLAPTAVTLLILGLLYLVVYYLSAGTVPLPIGDWNLAVGFGVMLAGGGMLMFWK